MTNLCFVAAALAQVSFVNGELARQSQQDSVLMMILFVYDGVFV